ncbi:MAG TPA: TonB-dependent receptor, partial [Candidatus Competibacteraceae bacterium]|nr:TonB-dependent receptor [Candidatus Competibacteraceae bacterium]
MTRGVAFTATSAFILAAAYCAAVPKTFGQAAPAAPAPAAAAADEEVIELDPFSVSATAEDAGYSVKDTLAGTRVRTELKDVSSAVSVVNAQFLKDTGAKKSEDLLIYTTGTEVGGMGGNFVGAGSNSYIDTATARLAPQNNTRVRGLDAADNTRNYFITDIP